jgi:hypothetical protein
MNYKTAKPRELTCSELQAVVGGVSTPRSNIQQVLSVGSQSSGAGAGKITFNPF